MAGSDCKKEFISFLAMALIELISVILATMYKAASMKGLSYFVNITYSNAIGALLFIPLLFIFPRCREGLSSIFRLQIFSKFVLLALVSFVGSVCAYKGIDYTSPAIASCIFNLLPAFTFIFAVIFRMERLDFRSANTLAKTIGTIVSISGSFVTILYKGPAILSLKSQPSSFLLEQSLRISNANWVIGGVLLVVVCSLVSLAYILQTQIVKLYPNELAVGVVASLLTSFVGAIAGAIVVTNEDAWSLRTEMALITVILTGIFGTTFITTVHTWGLNNKGPVYVTIFRPFSMVIAATLGVTLLGDTLYLGSVIGAVIILVGFYAVLWGKTKQKEQSRNYECDGESPLLVS